MILILSSAKTFKPTFKDEFKDIVSEPIYNKEVQKLLNILKQYSKEELEKVLKASSKIAEVNYERYHKFNSDHDKCISLLSFYGEVFKNIDSLDFSKEELIYSQKIIRILSGLYGIIRPLDVIKEYRLEMATKLNDSDIEDLYLFWKDKITNRIMNEIEESPGDKLLINLASLEYSSVLNVDKIKNKYKIVDIIFYEKKDNKFKVIGSYAKKARGKITRYIVKNGISTIEDIKKFHEDGYTYNLELSNSDKIVFTR
ncbi:MAG: YaaA family protein [Clostridiales bacterium]|nr:YaaA family protein [Clostridiales bacterium]